MMAQDSGGDKGESRSVRVLVADDNKDAADLLSRLIRAWGHDVRVVYDGWSALETAQAYLPDVALLDLGLPGVDGYQLALQFRRAPALRDVVLIAVTGYDWRNARLRSKEYGFEEHLVKPVEPERLRGLLEALKQKLLAQRNTGEPQFGTSLAPSTGSVSTLHQSKGGHHGGYQGENQGPHRHGGGQSQINNG